MIRTLALLCLIAAPAIGLLGPSLERTFGINLANSGKTVYVALPRTKASATDQGWVQKGRPTGPSGYDTLELWCPKDDNTVGVLTDPKTDKVAGVQIALNVNKFEPYFNMTTLGFTIWNSTENGTYEQFYAIAQYFLSVDELATDPESRTNWDYNSTLGDALWLTGFNGNLQNVSNTNTEYVTNSTTSPFTKQACIPLMGHHYYYNMTNTTECTAETIYPWFPLIYANKVAGSGFMVFGNLTASTNVSEKFEQPSSSDVEMIVPNGPQCLYDLAGQGLITMHIYVVDNIWSMLCVFEDLVTNLSQ